MQTKTKAVISVVLLAILVAGIGLAFFQPTQESEVKLRLKWINHSQFAGYYAAVQEGYYEQNGLDVEIIPGGATSPSIEMVAGGSEQFGVTGFSQLMEAREKGIPVVALATTYRKNPLIWFSVNERVQTAQELAGRKVGVTIGSNSDMLFRAMLAKAGVDIESVQLVPVATDISPVLTGQVDAYEGYLINQPLLAEDKGFKTYVINPEDYGIHFYGDTLFTTEEMIENHPEIVRGFVQASIKGWEFAYDNPDKAVDYTLMYSDQLTKEFETRKMNKSLELIRPDDKPIGTIEKNTVEEMYQLLVENGILKEGLDLDELYDQSFMQ